MGEQPIANVHWRYQWLWLYGFVHPESGETYYWILPKVNVELFNQVLADFAREFKLSQDKHIILTLDRAGWHRSKDLEIPVGLPTRIFTSLFTRVAACGTFVAVG